MAPIEFHSTLGLFRSFKFAHSLISSKLYEKSIPRGLPARRSLKLQPRPDSRALARKDGGPED